MELWISAAVGLGATLPVAFIMVRQKVYLGLVSATGLAVFSCTSLATLVCTSLHFGWLLKISIASEVAALTTYKFARNELLCRLDEEETDEKLKDQIVHIQRSCRESELVVRLWYQCNAVFWLMLWLVFKIGKYA